MITQVGYSVVEQSRGRVASCAVYIVHVEMRSVGFLVEPQNQGRRFVSGLISNHSDGFSSVWALKPMVTVYQWFDLKTI
jgi:hypothetical protein